MQEFKHLLDRESMKYSYNSSVFEVNSYIFKRRGEKQKYIKYRGMKRKLTKWKMYKNHMTQKSQKNLYYSDVQTCFKQDSSRFER